LLTFLRRLPSVTYDIDVGLDCSPTPRRKVIYDAKAVSGKAVHERVFEFTA
jgi:hypothetical protein